MKEWLLHKFIINRDLNIGLSWCWAILAGLVDMLLEAWAQEAEFCKGKDWKKKNTRGNTYINSRKAKASQGMAAHKTPL